MLTAPRESIQRPQQRQRHRLNPLRRLSRSLQLHQRPCRKHQQRQQPQRPRKRLPPRRRQRLGNDEDRQCKTTQHNLIMLQQPTPNRRDRSTNKNKHHPRKQHRHGESCNRRTILVPRTSHMDQHEQPNRGQSRNHSTACVVLSAHRCRVRPQRHLKCDQYRQRPKQKCGRPRIRDHSTRRRPTDPIVQLLNPKPAEPRPQRNHDRQAEQGRVEVQGHSSAIIRVHLLRGEYQRDRATQVHHRQRHKRHPQPRRIPAPSAIRHEHARHTRRKTRRRARKSKAHARRHAANQLIHPQNQYHAR